MHTPEFIFIKLPDELQSRVYENVLLEVKDVAIGDMNDLRRDLSNVPHARDVWSTIGNLALCSRWVYYDLKRLYPVYFEEFNIYVALKKEGKAAGKEHTLYSADASVDPILVRVYQMAVKMLKGVPTEIGNRSWSRLASGLIADGDIGSPLASSQSPFVGTTLLFRPTMPKVSFSRQVDKALFVYKDFLYMHQPYVYKQGKSCPQSSLILHSDQFRKRTAESHSQTAPGKPFSKRKSPSRTAWS